MTLSTVVENERQQLQRELAEAVGDLDDDLLGLLSLELAARVVRLALTGFKEATGFDSESEISDRRAAPDVDSAPIVRAIAESLRGEGVPVEAAHRIALTAYARVTMDPELGEYRAED
jgi:hypothetical protein